MHEEVAGRILGAQVMHNQRMGEEAIDCIASKGLISDTAWGSIASNRQMHGDYAEGHRGNRYYEGADYIDEIDNWTEGSARELFECGFADIRPISGNIANDCAFGNHVKQGDLVIVNSIPAGGHISHSDIGSIGYYTQNIIHFPMENGSNGKGGYRIDVEKARDMIHREKPKLAVFGKSLILFPEPLEELRDVCDDSGTRIFCDAAHVAGLIAGGCYPNPLKEGAYIMTMSTHKTLCGPERGLILSDMADPEEWKDVQRSVFPGKHSSHHTYTVPALGLTLCEMLDFGREYANQVIANTRALAAGLYERGFDVQAEELGFTSTHQTAVDVTRQGGGKHVARKLMESNIRVSKSLLPYDERGRSQDPSGIRIGTAWVTRYGMKEGEMIQLADFIYSCIVKGTDLRDDVRKLRRDFQNIHYSYDGLPMPGMHFI